MSVVIKSYESRPIMERCIIRDFDELRPPIVITVPDRATEYYYVHLDNMGSIQLISDSNANLINEWQYSAWGARTRIYGDYDLTDRGYTLHEHIPILGLINMNGRIYDPVLARFLSPDPFVQMPDFTQSYNRYSYCLNNPFSYTDPSGEFIFSALIPVLGVLIDAACWGAVIGAAGYTASVAFSDGGFSNWNWGEFGKAVGFGALSGVLTAGIGEAFGAIGSNGIIGEVGRAIFHGAANGIVSSMQGGNFWTGFASGALGSFTGSAFMMYGGDFASSKFGTYAFSVIAGGISAELFGGNFWQGATTGLMTAGLNHLAQGIQQKLNWAKATDKARIETFLKAYKEAVANGNTHFDLRKTVDYPTIGYGQDYGAKIIIDGQEIPVHLNLVIFDNMKISVDIGMVKDYGPFNDIQVGEITKSGIWEGFVLHRYNAQYVKIPTQMAMLQVPQKYSSIFINYLLNK